MNEPSKLAIKLAEHSRPVSVRERPLHPNIYLFGSHKIGKSILSCMVGNRPLHLAADTGWSSLLDWPELSHVIVDEIQNLNHFRMMTKALADNDPVYEGLDPVIVDPFNKLVDEYLDYLQDNYTPSTADSRVHWVPIGKSREEEFTTPGMGDYQAVRNFFRRPVHRLCRLPRTVIFVCHTRDPGITEKNPKIKSALPGKTHEMLAREVDLLAHMELKGGKRTISFDTNSDREVGSRLRGLQGKVIDASELPEIIKNWRDR